MVFVNDKKFACESCIKGHRSSSCGHTERPLFEIKKKGRPVSQCEKCRQLRKTKRVHSKCVCGTEKDDKREELKQLSANSKRYIPILPTLPNGIKDVLQTPQVNVLTDPRAQVVSLLNPCSCKDVWSCKCRPEVDDSNATGGLAALAQAAAMCCTSVNSPPPQELIEDENTTDIAQKGKEKESRPRSCCRPSSPSSPPSKRRRHRSRSKGPSSNSDVHKGPSLPPILSIPSTSALLPAVPLPDFPVIPPLGAIASLAGTGCTCGFDCTCPGCVEHRGPEHVEHDSDCSDSCSSCIDHSLAIELPTSTTYGAIPPETPTPSFMDAFFARAAALPLPPAQRASAANLDPTNVTVYPASLFKDEAQLDKHGAAFGLVQLPKLECCAGRCGCPGEECGCGTNCDGCCAELGVDEPENQAAAASAFAPPVLHAAKGSCCSG